MYVFVGERRSATAVENDWTWRDGRLAAKPLFEALVAAGVEPREQRFVNVFCDGDGPEIVSIENVFQILEFATFGLIVVAMGKKVQGVLREQGIEHISIVHPAARGKIRKTERYQEHIKEQLGL